MSVSLRIYILMAGLLTLGHFSAFSFQVTGIVQDASGEPIAYCNVGLYGKNTGTVTGIDGEFTLSEKHMAGVTKIKISHIAYKSRDVKLADIKASSAPYAIALEEKVLDVGEFVITGGDDFSRKRVLGSPDHMVSVAHIRAYSETLNYGEIIGNRFVIDQPSILDEFRFKLHMADCQSAQFRVRVISMKKKKKVSDRDLLTEDVFVTADRSGWYTVDLSNYFVEVDSDVLVGIQFLSAEGCDNSNATPYRIHMADYEESFVRTSNTEKWERLDDLGLAFQLKIYY